jgi:hypothetical protein
MNTYYKSKLLLIISIFVLFFLTQTVNASESVSNSYDRFCSLVSTALEVSGKVDEQHQYILTHFDEMVGNSDLMEAYIFSFQLSPERRYIEFRKSVEKILGQDWRCEQMDKYFQQYQK